MTDEELDPRADPVMARIRRAMPAHHREMSSATDPAAQALMKEITMNNSTLDPDTTTPPTPVKSDGSSRSGDGGNVIALDPRRNRLWTVAAAAAVAVGAVGASIAIQSGSSATDRVHAAAVETRELDSGVVRFEAMMSDTDFLDGESFEIDTAGIMRFDGDDSSIDLEFGSDDIGSFRNITVDGRSYSTGFDGEWQDVTDAGGASKPTDSTGLRFDEVLTDLERLDGYSQDGAEILDSVETTRYRVTAQEGELDGSAITAFAVTPSVAATDGAVEGSESIIPQGSVEYTVWIDEDGVVARLRAEAGDETASFVTDARFSDLGVPQVIEAPADFTVFDASALGVFEALAAVPDEVLHECMPEVDRMAELSTGEFDGMVDCLRGGGAVELADVFAELGPVGLDDAAASVVGDLADDE